MAAKRRRFGLVRKLPSGRFQALYPDPDGVRRPAPETFATKRAAGEWLALKEAELLKGEWTNPDLQGVLLGEFGNRWIAERSGLRPRTVDLYRWLFGRYIDPRLGHLELVKVDSGRVRSWRAGLLADGVSPTMAAKAYRLLRAILMTAVDDGIISRNPCRIRGAGTEHAPERPVLTVEQVFALVGLVPDRYAALILVTTFASLRWGEVTALRRCDVDVETGVVRVRAALVERSTGEFIRCLPKSRAGIRSVTLPRLVRSCLARHMDRYTREDPESLIFTGVKGAPLRRSNFNHYVAWRECVVGIGVPGLRFHDLRHTGNHLAARTGASLRDLMVRMGHDSMRAALIYQHAHQTGDQEIAEGIEDLIAGGIAADDETSPDDGDEDPDGSDGDGSDDDDDPDDGAAGALVPAG
jgi:integrase